MTRQSKSPKQRAEEALAVAQRKVVRLQAEGRKHRDAADNTARELALAVARRDYLADNPDLDNAKTAAAEPEDPE